MGFVAHSYPWFQLRLCRSNSWNMPLNSVPMDNFMTFRIESQIFYCCLSSIASTEKKFPAKACWKMPSSLDSSVGADILSALNFCLDRELAFADDLCVSAFIAQGLQTSLHTIKARHRLKIVDAIDAYYIFTTISKMPSLSTAFLDGCTHTWIQAKSRRSLSFYVTFG